MILSLVAAAAFAQSGESRGSAFVWFPGVSSFVLAASEPGRHVYTKRVDAGIRWDEMIASWNAAGGKLKVSARAIYQDRATRSYVIGEWSPAERTSVGGQADRDGDVLTDTLKLKQPASTVEITVEIRAAKPEQAAPTFIGLSFADTSAKPAPLASSGDAWGPVLEPPRKSQLSYPNGAVLCSPTCLSMMLGYWAKTLGRPELDKDVPEVQEQVYDPAYKGHGNWSFNMAYAGSFPGMRGYVTRLTDVSELEGWIASGVPVACSVSFNMLQGKPRKPDDGHLVVLVGFSKSGDPIFNDPGWSKEVRQTYKRADFDRAWQTSGRTVYLMYPARLRPPDDPYGHWASPGTKRSRI